MGKLKHGNKKEWDKAFERMLEASERKEHNVEVTNACMEFFVSFVGLLLVSLQEVGAFSKTKGK